MRLSVHGMLFGAAALVATSSIALAGEQTLEFKLVVKTLDPLVLQAANVEGQTMMASKAFGVAFFKDGRVAVKDFIGSSETLNGSGPMRGFSTYTFEDGSSITASYVGETKDGKAHGDYTILSGTGAYANATGTGSFDGVPTKFKGAGLLDGKFYKNPGVITSFAWPRRRSARYAAVPVRKDREQPCCGQSTYYERVKPQFRTGGRRYGIQITK